MLKVPTEGYATVAETGMKTDGKHSWGITAWIRLNGMGKDISILSREGAFDFGVSHGKLVFRMGETEVVQTDLNWKVNSDMWHYVAVTYDLHSLCFYVNGELAGKAAVDLKAEENGKNYVIGENLDGFIRSLKVYDSCPDGDEVVLGMFGETQDVKPCAELDFGCNPPADRCRPDAVVRMEGGCRSCVLEPALMLQGTAYAEPVLTETLNPGGKQVDPYTIQAEVWVTGKQPRQTVFVNGNHNEDAGMAIYLRYDTEKKGYRLCALRGSDEEAENKVVSDALVQTDRWVNVAVTYDGQSVCLYLDGKLDKRKDRVGPVLKPMMKGELLFGAMRENGKPVGINTLQGYIRRIDIWERALTEEEIGRYAERMPEWKKEGLAEVFDFTGEPFRSRLRGIPVALNDLARFRENRTDAPANCREPEPVRRNAVRANPDDLRRERDKLDLTAVVKRVEGNCGTVKKYLLLDVTHYVEKTDFVLVAHYATHSEPVLRCPIEEVDECRLRQVELVFILVGGAVSALFGLKTRLSTEAVEYILKVVLPLASVRTILAKGEKLAAADVYELGHVLYGEGALKPLLTLLVDLGFWGMLRFLAKAVLTFMGVGWADTIASLVATAAVFVVKFIRYVQVCLPPPSVVLESVTFCHSPEEPGLSALRLGEPTVPEWNAGSGLNNPVAYALEKLKGGAYIKASFYGTCILPTEVKIQAIAQQNNPLGNLGPVSVWFYPLVGCRQEARFLIEASRLGGIKVGYRQLEWKWEYDMGAGYIMMGTTAHEVYFLRDEPAADWKILNKVEKPMLWYDVLKMSKDWLPSEGVDRCCKLAPYFTAGIYNSSRFEYIGRSNFSGIDISKGVVCFFLTLLLEMMNGRGKVEIECSDCAYLLSLCVGVWGGEPVWINSLKKDNGTQLHTSYLKPIGQKDWKECFWNYHAMGVEMEKQSEADYWAYDCCLQLDRSDKAWQSEEKKRIPVIPGEVGHEMKCGTLIQTETLPPDRNYYNSLLGIMSGDRENINRWQVKIGKIF